METLVLENKYKIVVPLFGAAFAAPNKGAQQFYPDSSLYQQCLVLQIIVEFKDLKAFE